MYSQGRNRDSYIENRLVDTVEEGEGEVNWESSADTCILPYVKQLVGVAFQDRETNLVLCDNLEG